MPANRKLAAAVALHQEGRLDQAEALYREILSTHPQHADALHLSGLIAHQRGDHATALENVERAIETAPAVAVYHANKARILRALGRSADAVDAARAALALEPDNAETLSELSGALLEAEQSAAALTAAVSALKVDPDLTAAKHNLALAHFAEGQRTRDANQLDQAETHFHAALNLNPEMLEALVNLGNVLRVRHRLDDAAACYEAAIAKSDEIPEVWGNMGVVRQEMGDTARAIECYDKALVALPDNPEIRRNRAQALLKLGQFEDGWREFEWRWQTGHFVGVRRDWHKPKWDGQTLNGETVLVHAEQGFGDSLQFSRYLPMVAARGANVVVECPGVIASLMAGVEGVEKVVPFGEQMPSFDFQVAMMSLPGVFNTDFNTMPADVPYLSVPERAEAAWRDRLGASGGLRRVGLVWKGSAAHQRNEWRSPGLAVFKRLAELPEIQLFSLQKDDEADDIAEARLNDTITPLGQSLKDFSDTAAAVVNLDLVISPDTAVAHLAGALGKPVWLILPFACEWRWFEDRDDSPWYPSMRLFRQPRLNDWDGAVDAIIAALN